MAVIRVDASVVRELALALADVGAELAATGDVEPARWALGGGATGAALNEVLGNWRQERFLLVDALLDLAEAAAQAGTAYVLTESVLTRSWAGGVTG